jgi:beta-glucosidase
MYTISKFLFLILISIAAKISVAQQILPFQNPDLAVEDRITDLISRMTVEEKISQLHFDAKEIPRLGIKPWNYWGEALHGVARFHEATVFPQVIGLGSTWNPDLVEQMAFATGKEARVFNNQYGKGLTYFSPTINAARDPRWGRTEEAYSEDPYLTGRMGVAFVNGLQGKGKSDYMLAGATVKHFVADNSEFHRSVASSYIDMRDLREYYFPAFEMAVKEANVISVMPTYRGLNGIPNCANNWLLDKVLRQEWGFNGYTVSDCWAIHDIVKRQFYVTENEKAVQISLLAGLDLNCGDYYIQFLQSTLDKGYISEEDIDLALYRVLESRFLMGDFDPDHLVPWKSLSDDILNSREHQELATQTALESMVLLKNHNNALPINKDQYKSIAVIGIKAEEPEYGGYTGYPNQAVTILQGIQYKVGAAQNGFETIKAERFYEGSYIKKIINYSSFENQNVNLAGRIHPLMINNNDWIMLKDVDLGDGATGIILDAANEKAGGLVEIRLGSLDAEVIGTIKITDTGNWSSLKNFKSDIKRSRGIHDVYLTFKGDGEHLFNLTAFKFLPARKNYSLTKTDTKVTYAQGSDVIVEDRSGFEAALNAARNSELVVFVYGTDLTVANEGQDPADINVPAIQRELLQKVYEVNPNIVLVMAVGFPLIIDWEKENIPAIVGAWFAGQAQGTAVADVLFGDYNPGGKLPMTWYKSDKQLPDFSDYHIRKNNRTYQYFGVMCYSLSDTD